MAKSFTSPNCFDALSDNDDEEDEEEKESNEEIAALQLAIFQAKLRQKQMKKKKKLNNLNSDSIGGGFENTVELKVMKFDKAMSGPNKKNWDKATDEEHD
jgi:hypothetical protein